MNKSGYLSLGLFLAVALWMLSGAFAKVQQDEKTQISAQPASIALMKVKVVDAQAQDINREIVVQGELEPFRQVIIKAQTSALVQGISIKTGQNVSSKALLVELAVEDRKALIDQALAEVASQQLEVAAMSQLSKQGLQAENRLKSAQSALATAQAQLKRARLEYSYLQIKAPFAGIIEQRYVEIGSHVERGDQVALIVDESVIKAVGKVSQQSVGKLKIGQKIKIHLLDGSEATGVLTFISRMGDSETHSFRVEAEIPNPDGKLNAGVSAQLTITTGQDRAHFVSPSVLSLDDKGEIGIKCVDADDRVIFYPVKLVRTEADGVWLSGLPEKLRLITQGQGFVNAGEQVTPVDGQRS